MNIGGLTETALGENRVAMTPESARHIIKQGHKCFIQSGAGVKSGFSDLSYSEAGVQVLADASSVLGVAHVIVKVRPPTFREAELFRESQTLISLFWPNQNEDILDLLRDRSVNVIAMDMVPRISRAQKMDALSSMANIAGYRAVMEAGNNFGRFFAGQVTAAGKIPPAKVLVIGAGVAGLAAIGASTSLGAMTYAFDVRPEVAEQIESMGAEFVYLDFGEQQSDGAATGGYAAPSSPEFYEAQLKRFRELAPDMDIVITTALIPGRPAPKLWLSDMVAMMKPGSVVVDLAAERGGNCDLTVPDDKTVTPNGVTVIGYTDFPSRMAAQASSLYSTNIRHMLSDLTPKKDGVIHHNMDDDVIRSATIAKDDAITWPPPPLKIAAIALQKAKEKIKEPTPEEKRSREQAAFRRQTLSQVVLLLVGGAAMGLIGTYAPASLMQHVIVFVLAIFIGFQVIWNVSHSLHTPLMAVTNAVSGIIILGALLQIGETGNLVQSLAAVAVLIATINIVGGFMVTRRMLQMFQKS